MNSAVSDIDRKVQDAAATAEESAAASEEMNRQSYEMKKIVEELMSIIGSDGLTTEDYMGPIYRKYNGKTSRVNPRLPALTRPRPMQRLGVQTG